MEKLCTCFRVKSNNDRCKAPEPQPIVRMKLSLSWSQRMKSNRRRDLLMLVFCWMLCVASPTFGQAPQPGGGPPGPGGFFGGGGMLGLVARDEVQQELQLVDEQK